MMPSEKGGGCARGLMGSCEIDGRTEQTQAPHDQVTGTTVRTDL